MAKSIKQILLNEENKSNAESFISGSAFSDIYPIAQLGIQSLPGTTFYLNGSTNPIRIGASGIFDLDIKNEARITELKFGAQSINRIINNGGYVIVDVIKGEEDS